MTRQSVNNGRQLRFSREYRKYTQSALCKEIKGLSQANLSKYENGFQGMLKDEMVVKIMNHLNWPVEWLEVKASNIYTSWDL